ncbi:hypothetical protein CRG98_017959 [Punica granatum]|uniref:Uncharacterized protein n=1 Tax=Punica granatum TaxID=22663 RepID=A0A2I0JZ87_PUNGR|nr:hypothetical protein CRG98_017959 [Punica granatum]
MAGTRLKGILKLGADLKRVENSPGTKLKQLEKFPGVVGKFWKTQELIGRRLGCCWRAGPLLDWAAIGLLDTGQTGVRPFWPFTRVACATREKEKWKPIRLEQNDGTEGRRRGLGGLGGVTRSLVTLGARKAVAGVEGRPIVESGNGASWKTGRSEEGQDSAGESAVGSEFREA